MRSDSNVQSSHAPQDYLPGANQGASVSPIDYSFTQALQMHSNDVAMEENAVASYENTLAQASRLFDNANTPGHAQPPSQLALQQQQFSTQSHKPCNCRKSRCLKLYCECFANNRFCGPQCACCNCHNTKQHDAVRLQAKQQILMRNPHAFRSSKVIDASSASGSNSAEQRDTRHHQSAKQMGELTESGEIKHHFKGCNCRRTKC